MNDRDKVKVTIYSKSTGLITLLTSRELAKQFREDVMTNSIVSGWYEISGRINDADSNEISIVINFEDIAGFDIVELNSSF
jgi:hypothetical protein